MINEGLGTTAPTCHRVITVLMGINMVRSPVIREVNIPNRATVIAALPGLRIPYSRRASAATLTELRAWILGIWKRSSCGPVARQLALWYIGSYEADS